MVVKRGRILNYVVGKIMWLILYLMISGIVGLRNSVLKYMNVLNLLKGVLKVMYLGISGRLIIFISFRKGCCL